MYDFVKENKLYCVFAVAIMLLCLAGAWLVYDAGRNEHIQVDTDHTMEDINQRMDNAAERIGSAAAAITKTEEAVGAAAAGIAESERAAADIAGGIKQCQDILDGCIQRAGRIENILADIEAGDRQRAAGTSPAALAK